MKNFTLWGIEYTNTAIVHRRDNIHGTTVVAERVRQIRLKSQRYSNPTNTII